MAFIKFEKPSIREKNLPSYHGLDFIRGFQGKSHAQPKNLPSCHEMGKSFVFPNNRCVSEKVCFLALILQGGIAYFAIFSTMFTMSRKIARNEKKYVALPDLKRDFCFPKKSFISRNNLSPFHDTIHNCMFSEKSHDLSYGLMSSRCVGIICYVLRKIKYSMFQINVYQLCRV